MTFLVYSSIRLFISSVSKTLSVMAFATRCCNLFTKCCPSSDNVVDELEE